MAEDAPVVVVSGASRGIGEAIVRALVARGARVVATARRPTAALAARLGVREVSPLDVTDPALVDALAERVGPVDALVNNAGVALDGFDADVVRRTLAVNVHGVRRLTDRLLPQLRAGGRVVMVSSGLGELAGLPEPLRAAFAREDLTLDGLLALLSAFEADVGAGRHRAEGWPSSAYRVSKVALNALTRLYARAYRDDPRGLRFDAACPGWVATAMGGPSAPRTPAEGADTPVWLALDAGGPTGRFYRDRGPIPW